MDKDEAGALARFGVTDREIEQALGRVKVSTVDYADLYFEYCQSESVSMEEGIVKRATKSIGQGVGVRATVGEKTGFAYSDDLTKKDLNIAADTARYIANSAQSTAPVPVTHRPALARNLYPHERTDIEVATRDRVLVECHRCRSPTIRSPDQECDGGRSIPNTRSCWSRPRTALMVGDVQPLSRLQVTCIAEENGNRQVGSFGGGGRVGLEYFHEGSSATCDMRQRSGAGSDPQSQRRRCAGRGHAGRAGRRMAGYPAARGHRPWSGSGLQPQEDLGLLQSSREEVASDVCTIVDDGTLPFRRGSLNMDDEGTPTGRTVLIERGILRGYITDKLNARLMGIPVTGNGRRESYQSVVLPRMTNTFMLAGSPTLRRSSGRSRSRALCRVVRWWAGGYHQR